MWRLQPQLAGGLRKRKAGCMPAVRQCEYSKDGAGQRVGQGLQGLWQGQGAGDGYDNTALKKIIRANASGLMRFKKHSSIADGPVLLFTHKSSYIIDNLHQSLYYLTIF